MFNDLLAISDSRIGFCRLCCFFIDPGNKGVQAKNRSASYSCAIHNITGVLFELCRIYVLKGEAGWVIYAPWFLLAFSPLLSPLFDLVFVAIENKYWRIGTQVVIFLLCGAFLLSEYDDRKSLPVKKYAYYADHKKWEKILHSCKKQKPTDLLCLNYQNLALAEQGVLADSLLMYTQQGSKGLFVDWNMTPFVSMTLQKICYYYGDIASARKYAFECNVCVIILYI